jgi:nucleoside 2-deoxyribosyltransferase
MNETNGFRCLFIGTKFSEESHSLRQLIADALVEVGIKPILLEEIIVHGTSIVESIQQAIARADLVIVDLTESNPNVMYEMGFAHALRKPVLPIVQQRIGHVPSDIAGYLYLVYDPSEPDELRHNIQTWAVRHHSARMQGELQG